MTANIKLKLIDDTKFFGPGACSLLEEIESNGSIQAACKSMGVSYSKGSHVLKSLEQGMNTPMVQRWTGGNGGGGAKLTVEGKEMVRRYREMEKNIEQYAKMQYDAYFGDSFGTKKE